MPKRFEHEPYPCGFERRQRHRQRVGVSERHTLGDLEAEAFGSRPLARMMSAIAPGSDGLATCTADRLTDMPIGAASGLARCHHAAGGTPARLPSGRSVRSGHLPRRSG